jgi:hypothetical protein
MQEEAMQIPMRSERQRRTALRILLEVEDIHVAQCECVESCAMLPKLREDIAWLRDQQNDGPLRCPTRTAEHRIIGDALTNTARTSTLETIRIWFSAFERFPDSRSTGISPLPNRWRVSTAATCQPFRLLRLPP